VATSTVYDAKSLWPCALAMAVMLAAGCSEQQAVDEDMPPAIERELADQQPVEAPAAAPAASATPGAVVVAPMPPPPTPADTAQIPVDVIVVTPAPHLGKAVSGTAQVPEVISDRGFWLENNGQRMLAIIAQAPGMEQAVNVNAGQTVRLSGVVYDNALASGIAGQLDPQAKQLIAEQPAFLLVDAKNITVVEAPSG
jgi:hypothetical protein